MSIRIFNEDIDFRLKGWKKIKKLVEKVICEEKKVPGDLVFILTNDRFLRKLNREYLKHNYNTDVISFNLGNELIKIDGEIYISIETVKRNAINYKVSYNCELLRVIIHGVLHLCGYEDKGVVKKREMKKREEYWLKIYEGV